MLKLLFNRMPDIIGKKYPDRDDVLKWFHTNSDKHDELISFQIVANNMVIFRDTYSADDFMDNYDQWNLINQTLS